ncbi:TolC family outer membrane protein [Rhabdaerophilum sp. SD176]|uniref:TolC family outer membrane protein n=1 Tax=Rhabdaerophilum sp. SD176 TaxID=2983548 RepID=UPI0024DF8E03|nr:TolC family outer membrane protein [Rhabdaerophilum sp. SD176]
MKSSVFQSVATAALVAGSLVVAAPLRAQDLNAALAHAYMANPDLNAQRANTRSVDEGVPTAKSGNRPRITLQGDAGYTAIDGKSGGNRSQTELMPRSVTLSATQTIYNGNRTSNSIRQAESSIFASRETLRNTEQNTLLDGVTAYMNVVRDQAILQLRQNNVNVLNEQVRQTKDRFNVGEVTRTDVAQAEARLAGARSDLAVSQSNLRGSVARFKQIIGMEPKRLGAVKPVAAARLPKNQGEAVNRAIKDHPAISAALHGVDAQSLQVKIVEGELYPTVSLTGSLARRYDSSTQGDSRNVGSVLGTVSIPIYDGGSTYSRTRAAKETLGERRLQVDSARDRVIQAVVASWALMEATGFQIEGANAQVAAAEIALNGVREEARVGQRTTLDVLNAQQELLNARVSQVTAQRDRVVASYALLSATGQLSARSLGLKVATYDPKVHFEQVKDSWLGLRTPSGE